MLEAVSNVSDGLEHCGIKNKAMQATIVMRTACKVYSEMQEKVIQNCILQRRRMGLQPNQSAEKHWCMDFSLG